MSTLEDSNSKVHLNHFINSQNRIQGSSPPIVAITFTSGGKDINERVKLPHAQWIISKPKNKTIARHNISNRQQVLQIIT